MADSRDEIGGDWRGRRLGRWTLVAPIGSGGLGAVYEAIDSRGTRAALKAFDLSGDATGTLSQAFERESGASRLLSHPDIVTVFDAGEDQGIAYLVMEHVEGHDLSRHVREARSLPDAVVLEVGERLARALAHAHGQGIVHRDLKPGNVLVNWPRGVIKLCDFGLARLGDVYRSRTGVMFGTPAYMSPEQLADAPADARTDLYALGVVLYELLAGRLPHAGRTLGELLRQVAQEPALPLLSIRPDLPDDVASLVQRLLAKRPEDRPADARTAAEELARVRLGVTPAAAGWPVGAKSRG